VHLEVRVVAPVGELHRPLAVEQRAFGLVGAAPQLPRDHQQFAVLRRGIRSVLQFLGLRRSRVDLTDHRAEGVPGIDQPPELAEPDSGVD
jgi:hypothetical protein